MHEKIHKLLHFLRIKKIQSMKKSLQFVYDFDILL